MVREALFFQRSIVLDQVIPILPCPNIKVQTEFYRQLGFDIKAIYTSPNPYAVVTYGEIELHFYGNRKREPAANSSMCFIRVDDVDAIYEVFVSGLKTHLGKIPRSGLPRISKVRDLSLDRRFTLTDLGGNTFYIGTPVSGEEASFFRTLANETYAQKFAVLYDLLHSKEDPEMAAGMLPKFDAARAELRELDLAKLLLVELEISRQLGQDVDGTELEKLLDNQGEDTDWAKVRQRHGEILDGD